MRKNLVYHFYTFNGFRENIANKAHFFLMEKYFHLFDKMVFYIVLDDVSNIELINETRTEILKHVRCNDIIFKTKQNTELRDAETFKSGIIDNENNLEYSVFFAHNKGTTNVVGFKQNENNIIHWIHALYFYSLNNIDLEQMENFFYNDLSSFTNKGLKFYGPCLCTKENCDDFWYNNNKIWYAGTFFWFHMNRYISALKEKKIEKPIICDRYDAERFPGNFGIQHINIESRNSVKLSWDIHQAAYWGNWCEHINMFGDVENYNKEHEELLKQIV